MKKITLMLCACAMAFAGLLVSCSNGTEKWIDGTSGGSYYAYAISGTVTEKFEDSTTTQTTVYTLAKGRGGISNSIKDSRDQNKDNVYYGYINFDGKGDRSVTNGTAAAVKTYNVSYGKGFNIYKLDDGYYLSCWNSIYNSLKDSNVSFDKIKLESAPEFDGEDYTLKFTFVKDDSTESATDKTTFSGEINFKAVDAE